MTLITTAPEAGWYPDPLGTRWLRWWDADGWTEHLADRDGAAPAPGFAGLNLPAPDPDAEIVIPEPIVTWADWSIVAERVREVMATGRPRIVHVQLDDLDPIVIDTRYHAYGWTGEIADLPRWVRRADLVVQLQAPLAPTVFGMRSGPVEELLAVLVARAS
jgi:hypothetical protein